MERKHGDVSRVKRSRAEARAAYDRMSGWYELITDPFEGRYRQQGLTALSAQPGDQVLEIGSGPGQALVKIAEMVGPEGVAVGLDLAGGMLRRSQRRLRKANSQASLLQADGVKLPVATGVFDRIFISFTLELFDTPEIPAVLGECGRALRQGGSLAVVSMAKRPDPNLMTNIYEWFHQHFPQYADCRPIWVQAELEKAGFRVEQRRNFSMMGLPGALVRAYKP